jgi:lysine 2,3-aminomutase
MKNRITKLEQITQVINLTREEEEGIKNAKGGMAMAITPYWATLLDPDEPSCPIRRRCVPMQNKFHINAYEMSDPCSEDSYSPAPHLVHRYPDCVLLLSSESCAMYCRHCTPRRIVGHEEKNENPANRLDAAIEYIRWNKKSGACSFF